MQYLKQDALTISSHVDSVTVLRAKVDPPQNGLLTAHPHSWRDGDLARYLPAGVHLWRCRYDTADFCRDG